LAANVPLRVGGAIMDITAEKQVLERLNESAERMRLAEMAASFGIWEMNLATGIVKGSEAWAALERVSDANAGRHVDEVREIVHPDDRWLLSSGSDRAFATGEPYSVEFRIVPEPGIIRWTGKRIQFVDVLTLHPKSLATCRQDMDLRCSYEDERRQGRHRLPSHAGRRPPPARVSGGDRAPHRVHDQDGKAVRGLDAQESSRRRGHRGVGLRPSRPRRATHARPVHLLQEEERAGAFECRRDPAPRLVALFPPRGTQTLLEAVNEARHFFQGRHSRRAEGLGHVSILNR